MTFARYEGFVQNVKLGNEELRRRKNISGTGNSKYTSPEVKRKVAIQKSREGTTETGMQIVQRMV